MKEFWRNIKGYGGDYQVSSLGRVRSFKYNEPRMLKPGICGGYKNVKLTKGKENKTSYVHRLVALHFIGGYKKGLTVNHKNFNKLNNTVENLEWMTNLENVNNGKINGKKATGEKNGSTKFKEIDIRLIRYKHRNGKSISQIGREHDTGTGHISLIVNGKIWN